MGQPLTPLVLLTDESIRDPVGTVGRVQAELRRANVPVNVEASVLNSVLLLGALRHEARLIDELQRSISMSIDLRESYYYQKILSEGEQKGRQEGLQEGRLEEARSILLRLTAKKLGTPTEEIERAFRELTDRERVQRMMDRAYEATTWEDLLSTP